MGANFGLSPSGSVQTTARNDYLSACIKALLHVLMKTYGEAHPRLRRLFLFCGVMIIFWDILQGIKEKGRKKRKIQKEVQSVN